MTAARRPKRKVPAQVGFQEQDNLDEKASPDGEELAEHD